MAGNIHFKYPHPAVIVLQVSAVITSENPYFLSGEFPEHFIDFYNKLIYFKSKTKQVLKLP